MMVGITVAIALVSWNAWEKQFLKLKRFFPYGADEETSMGHVAASPPLVSAAL